MTDDELYQKVLRTPKQDLHIHLEGSVNQDTLRALAAKNGVDLTKPAPIASKNNFGPVTFSPDGSFKIQDFKDFMSVYLKVTECIRDTDDIITIGRDYCESARAQNVTLSEIYFTPTTFKTLGIALEPLYDGLMAVQKMAQSEFGTTVRWIFDIVCNVSRDGRQTVEHALRARQRGVDVVAIGLAGFEKFSYPAKNFKESFQKARAEGFKTFSHAGETNTAEHMKEVILTLEPERIGHGIAAAGDQETIELLLKKEIPLELSPWSNILLGVCGEEHQALQSLHDAGIPITLCSDDPGILAKTLSDNHYYAAKRNIFGTFSVEI